MHLSRRCGNSIYSSSGKTGSIAGGIVKYFVDIPWVEAMIVKQGNDEQIAQPKFRFGECAKFFGK